MTDEEKERAEWAVEHGWRYLFIAFVVSGFAGLAILAIGLYLTTR